MERLRNEISEYVALLLHTHDMSVGRNEFNVERHKRIVDRCMGDLESHPALASLL